MLTWIRLSIPLPEVIIPPSLFTLVGLLVLKTVLLNTCTWPTLFVLASTGNDGAATWSDLGGSSDTDDVIIGYDSAEQLEIQRRLTYSAQIMTKQFSSILNTDWKRLDRILSDSDNWQNAQSKQTSLENMKSVLIEAAARLSDYLTGFAGSVYDTAIAIETHAETFKLSADTGAIKKVTVVPDSLQYDKKRQAYVNFNSTSLHLPVEIWSGSTSMQQELAWSAGMDKIFADSQKSNPDLYWSYFGTPLGLLRVYPGTQLNMNSLYDVRLDHWYIQTSTPPKHMLIAIDASGSVYGLVLELMRNTASQLLDSLNDNDFVNIIGFHEKPFPLRYCLREHRTLDGASEGVNFVRATERNKLALKQLLRTNLAAENIASFENMFSYSYSVFRNLTEEDTVVPICSKVLMVITDGADGEAKDAYGKISDEVLDSVRIFTYVEGSSVYEDDSLSWIACRNRGFFHKVPTKEAVRMQAMEYLQVLSRPMALNYHQMFSFSAPAIQNWNQNLGHALAVTYPVYRNTYRKTLDEHWPHFLGVVGKDIPLLEIGQRVPTAGLSHDGLVIMINSKGHVVYHSNFFMLANIDLKYTPTVDISEILHLNLNENEFNKVKLRMLMLPVGQVNMENVIATFHVERYAYTAKSELVYTKIDVNATKFVLALLMPVADSSLPASQKIASNIFTWKQPYRACNKICQFNLLEAIPKKNDDVYLDCEEGAFFCGRLFVAPMPFCPKILKYSSKSNLEMLVGLKRLLIDYDSPEDDCLVQDDKTYHYGNSLLQQVKLALEEIIQTFKIFDQLKEFELDRFIITSSGVSVIYNNQFDPQWWEKVRNPRFSPLLKKHLAFIRLVEDGSDFIIFSSSYQFDNRYGKSMGIEPLPDCFGISGVTPINKAPSPIATKLITRGDSYAKATTKVPLGVLGKVLDKQYFDQLLSGSEHASLCNNSDNSVQCYLVDEGAFVIASTKSNDTDNTGRSFYAIENCLMQDLVAQGIYKQIIYKNNLCTCPSRIYLMKESAALTISSHSILQVAGSIPSRLLNSNVLNHFILSIFKFISSLSINLLWSTLWALLNPSIADAQDFDHPHGYSTPCSIEEKKFTPGRKFFSQPSLPIWGVLDSCVEEATGVSWNCSVGSTMRSYSASWVPNTNLQLVVVTEATTDDWCWQGYVIPTPKQYQRREYDICNQPKYHRDPPNMTCPADHHLEEEVYKKCGGSHTLFPPPFKVLPAFFLILQTLSSLILR